MPIDAGIAGIVVASALGVIASFCGFLFNKALANERKLAEYKVFVAENYVKKDEIKMISRKLDSMEAHSQERWEQVMHIFLNLKGGSNE